MRCTGIIKRLAGGPATRSADPALRRDIADSRGISTPGLMPTTVRGQAMVDNRAPTRRAFGPLLRQCDRVELRAGPQGQAAPGGDIGPAHHPVTAVQRLLGRMQHPGVGLETAGDHRGHHIRAERRQPLTDPAGLPDLIAPGRLRIAHHSIIAVPQATRRPVIQASPPGTKTRQSAPGRHPPTGHQTSWILALEA